MFGGLKFCFFNFFSPMENHSVKLQKSDYLSESYFYGNLFFTSLYFRTVFFKKDILLIFIIRYHTKQMLNLMLQLYGYNYIKKIIYSLA